MRSMRLLPVALLVSLLTLESIGPYGITAAFGAIWFTESGADRIGAIIP